MLRLIAAIAGCGYDDLKQRDQARRRKRTAIAITLAIAVIAAIIGAVAFASNARSNAQIAESQRLATESTQLLSQGDRYGAIEKALEALPQSESSNDRPFVPEARTALENALEINSNPNSAWLASYEIQTDAPLGYIGTSSSHETDSTLEDSSVIAVSDSGGFFALSDSDGQVRTYDIQTGRKLAECVMPDEALPLDGGLYYRTMGATENYLVVANGGDASVLAVFDARTGEMVESASDTGCPSFDTLYGDDLVSMSFPRAEGGYSVTIADLETGTTNSMDVAEVGMVTADPDGYFNTPGERLGDNYSAFGNRLFFAQFDSDSIKSVELAYPEATSLKYVDGLVLAASAEPLPDDDTVRRFAIEAFDSNLEPLWKHEGSFTSEMIVNNGISSLVTGVPVVYDAVGSGSKVVASVGREVLVLDSATGKLVDTIPFDQTIVGVDLIPNANDTPDDDLEGGASGDSAGRASGDSAGSANDSSAGDANDESGSDSRDTSADNTKSNTAGDSQDTSADEPELITVACSNGTVNCKELSSSSLDVERDGRLLVLPFPIRWAHFTPCGEYYVLLAVPADSDNRIVSFRTNWSRGEQADVDYSLDELVELADEVLAEGGRG